jgi:hypothetical protein
MNKNTIKGSLTRKSKKLLKFSGIQVDLSPQIKLECNVEAINPLNAKLNPICHLLALLGAHRILHVSRERVNAELPLFARISYRHS